MHKCTVKLCYTVLGRSVKFSIYLRYVISKAIQYAVALHTELYIELLYNRVYIITESVITEFC